MKDQATRPGYTIRVSDSFGDVPEAYRFEAAFRRWLVGEIRRGELTVSQAVERFGFNPKNGRPLIDSWLKRYGDTHPLPLAQMTEAELAELKALQERIKALEKELDQTKLRGTALDTMIDVAEDQFKIEIRKKAGTKQ
jgi:transposase-like protein